jgi:DNA-directed RNA polymerase specialized sigma24 family protein
VSIDDLVLTRAQKGDSSALDAVLRHHYEAIRTVCHRIVMNTADAEDATQMALISVARALPSFDRRSSLSTWIYRIATNAAIDELRRINRRPIPTQDSALERSQPDATGEIDTSLFITQALGHVSTVRSRLSRGRAQLSEIVGNQLHASPRHNSVNDAHAPKDGRP